MAENKFILVGDVVVLLVVVVSPELGSLLLISIFKTKLKTKKKLKTRIRTNRNKNKTERTRTTSYVSQRGST